MLGASGAQVQGIEKAKSLGCQLVTCDYIAEAIGHRVSDEVDTIDFEHLLACTLAGRQVEREVVAHA